MRYSVSYAALAAALVTMSLAALAAASSAEEIVVTASRAPGGLTRAQLGGSVTLLQPLDLRLRQTRTVSDVLRDVPGISVSRLGGVGGQTQVRLRGSESNHTLVLIDGLEASDPFQGEFDFSALIADDVARIEVLRGQQSALYGSDAIGGVINYLTVSGTEAPGARGRIEAGSFGTTEGALRIAGADGALDYVISAGHRRTDGTPNSRFGSRDLGAENTALSGRLVYELSPNLKLRAIARYLKAEADVNDQDFAWGSPTYGYVIDSDDSSAIEQLYGLVGADLDLMEGAWSHSLTLQSMDASRDGFSGGARDSGNEGNRVKLSYVSSYRFGMEGVFHNLTGAIDWKREKFRNSGPGLSPAQALERQIENTGLVAQYDLAIGDHIGFGAAMRYDENERFRNATTYRVHASYLFESGARLHAAGGSGIKAPGFYELFGFDPDGFIGNPDLKAERSHGWEAGIEQTFLDGRVRLDATYFDTRLEDEIYTDFSNWPISTAANRDTVSKQRGVEVSAEALIGDAWRVHAAWAWLDAEEGGQEEVRRPPHIGSLNLSYVDPSDAFSATLTVRYNGETLDNNFTSTGGPRVTLPAFTLVNAGGDVRLNEGVRLFARIENLFDETYEEVYTYRAPGRAALVGLRAEF
ncbi:MAG: TonB-dependent receptor [Alphaproteobacteria bacterium]|nr:TonB-dependent receptor [Alphaproteobacteria bacterium]